MFQPYFAFIAYRYTRAKQKNHFIAFMSISSVIGIALGVAVLITVLSVMNGFSQAIRDQILKGTPHVRVEAKTDLSLDDVPLNARLGIENVIAEAPYIQGQGILTHQGEVQGVFIKGVLDPTDPVFGMQKHLVATQRPLEAGQYGIYIGKQLANQLGVKLGDKISLIIPEMRVSLLGVSPRFKRFTVDGIFEMGGFFDSAYALVHLSDAATLFQFGPKQISGIQFKLADELLADQVSQALIQQLPASHWVSNWMQQHAPYLSAIQMEKTVMTFILLLIVAVAAFNLVSGLVMLVMDKQSDIAILRAMGATTREIMGIFMIQGSLLGCVGVIIGSVAGVLLSLHVTEVVNLIERCLGTTLFQSDVYWVDALPSRLLLSDVLFVAIFALFFSFLATLYPAYRASQIRPAEALRYE